MSAFSPFTPNLLSDVPSKIDEFRKQQAHEKIARAISKLLIQSSTAGTIALIGPMGSGKSSTIEMLKEIHQKDAKYVRIFVFDAWAHQGESLRRIFLEKLGNYLLSESSTAADKQRDREWNNKLQSITVVQETSRESAVPTPWGIALAAAIFLTALGLLFLSQESRAGMAIVEFARNLPLLPKLDNPDKVGTFFLILAIIVMLGAALVFWGLPILLNRFGLFSTSASLARQIVSNTTIRTLDPSSIEFAELFKFLMRKWESRYSSLPVQERKWKLLIVIDNLDRVPNEVVWNLWSTLQVFIETRINNQESEEPDWMKNVWILAAFDQDALIQNITSAVVKAIPPKEKGNQTSGNKKQSKPIPSADGSIEVLKPTDSRIRELIAKTFQITFRVPLPHPEAWKEYFKSQYKKIFRDEKDAETIFAVYRNCRSKNNMTAPPTPREINLFLNNLQALCLRREGDIPIGVVGLYTFIAEEMGRTREPIKAIEQKVSMYNFVFRRAGVLDKEECRRQLAALHFGANLDDAIPLLVEEPLRIALFKHNKENTKNLDYLITVSSGGYLSFIQNLLNDDDDVTSRKPQEIANLVRNLDHINDTVGFHEDTTWKESIWPSICEFVDGRESTYWETCEEASLRSVLRTLSKRCGNETSDKIDNVLRGKDSNSESSSAPAASSTQDGASKG